MKFQIRNQTSPTSDPLSIGFIPLLRGSAQQEFDRLAVEEFGFPSFTLMENAGRSASDIIEREFGSMHGRKIVLCCGSGNNGGDGYVIARTLYNRGAHVCVISLKPPSAPDAAKNFTFLQNLESSDPSGRLKLIQDTHHPLPAADLYVDAFFGVGLNRPIQGKAIDLIHELNSSTSPVVAIDLPSGLHADTGLPLSDAVRADLTVTFSAYKPGLLFGQGSEYSGKIELAHIGLPLSAILHESPSCIDWISSDSIISQALPSRDVQAHKYSTGMVLVIGGSPGLSGAPMLASHAAARAGAGYVACAVPESIQSILATSMIEIPVISLSEYLEDEIDMYTALDTDFWDSLSAGGQIPYDGISPEFAPDMLVPWLAKANAIVIGPGLGKHHNTQDFVRSILQTSEIPMVIDADALPIAVEFLNTSNPKADWILTPHAGEFSRMVGDSEKNLDRLDSVRHWSSEWNCTLVLKGQPTIISHAGSEVVVCGRGNSALATAGTGDVLAGICGSLLAQGCSGFTAAVCASHIGGFAADQYIRRAHPGTMVAGDMIHGIIDAITALQKN